MSFFTELKRRNVFRVGIAYAVAAWVFLQVVDLVMEYVAAPIWIMHLIMMLVASGFPAVLIGAWLFEITPEGVKRERDIDRSQSITHETGRKLDRLVIVFLLVAVVFLLADRFTFTEVNKAAPITEEQAVPAAGESAPEPAAALNKTEKSIAVLPFRDMSAAQDQAYFGEGIAEELLNALVKLDGLKVASRTSAFSLAGENLDIPTIAQRLGVNHILEGSVRTAGKQVRVTAQLIDVSEDVHLWSETYDGSLDDIFKIQDEITAKITDAMKVQFGDGALASAAEELTANAEAYQLYLQGRHLWRQRSGPALEHAVRLFKRAVELDPQFHQAWSNLAVAYLNLPDYAEGYDASETFELGLQAADRALALNPRSTEARIIKANYLEFHCNTLSAAREYEAAIADDPDDPTARHWYAILLMSVGRTGLALEHIETAERLDPLISAVKIIKAVTLAQNGAFDRAIALAQEASALGFEGGSPAQEAFLRLMAGQKSEAVALLREAVTMEGASELGIRLGLVADAVEDPARMPALEAHLNALDKNDMYVQFDTSDILALLGSPALFDFFSGLECPRLSATPWSQPARKLRATPEFFQLMERASYVDYWRAMGWPDDCASLDQSLAECPE